MPSVKDAGDDEETVIINNVQIKVREYAVIVHAWECHKWYQKRHRVNRGTCQYPRCEDMRRMLLHAMICSAPRRTGCRYQYCKPPLYDKIILHYEWCETKEECRLCKLPYGEWIVWKENLNRNERDVREADRVEVLAKLEDLSVKD